MVAVQSHNVISFSQMWLNSMTKLGKGVFSGSLELEA